MFDIDMELKLMVLTEEEINIIKTGIDVAQFESQLPETEESETIRHLLEKLNTADNLKNLGLRGEWLLAYGENFMSIQPMYYCSSCKGTISTYTPPVYCPHCGSSNTYKMKTIRMTMKEE